MTLRSTTTTRSKHRFIQEYPVLELSVECKLVLRFAIRDFVSFEPVYSCLQVSRL